MSEPVWYYAQGEEEKGPITTAQIKALARVGRLRGEDLVWKEGMDDWKPASDIRGLIPAKGGSNGSPADSPAQFEEPTAESPVVNEPPKFQGTVPAKEVVQTSPVSPTPAAAPTPAQMAPTPPKTPRFDFSMDSVTLVRQVGRTLALIGMLLAITSRGCDSLGSRSVARLNAISIAAQRDTTEPAESRREKATAAKEADLNDAMSGFWRQAIFVLGTLLLVPGLAMVGTTTEGAERWASFTVLAIIVFSLYVVGHAWTSAGPADSAPHDVFLPSDPL